MDSIKYEGIKISRKKENQVVSGLSGWLVKKKIAQDSKRANIILFIFAILLFVVMIGVLLTDKSSVQNNNEVIIPSDVPFEEHYKYYE